MYVGIMTVINSVREILSVPGSTLGSERNLFLATIMVQSNTKESEKQ